MHRDNGAARCRRCHRRKQTGCTDAETQLLALHVARSRIDTQRRKLRVAELFVMGDGHYRDHEDDRHCCQQRPALAYVADDVAEDETQCGRDQEDRQQLKKVRDGGGVFIRMRRVGVEETATIGAQHFDGFL
ncbi:hypothetical protein D3C87_1473600 [compost metagenome]